MDNEILEGLKKDSIMLDEVHDYVLEHISSNGKDNNEDIDMYKILEQAQENMESGKTTFAFTLDEFLLKYNACAKSTNTEEFTDTPRVIESEEAQSNANGATCYLKAGKEMDFSIHKNTNKVFLIVLQAESKEDLEEMFRNSVNILDDGNSFDAIMDKVDFYKDNELLNSGVCISLNVTYCYTKVENIYSFLITVSGIKESLS